MVCLGPSSKQCFNNLTPFRNASLIETFLVKCLELKYIIIIIIIMFL